MRLKYSEFIKLSENDFINRMLNDDNCRLKDSNESEIDSWKSTRSFFISINHPKSDFYLSFEYPMPFCSERIDVLIESNNNLFVIEMKQWDNSNHIEKYDDDYVIFEGDKRRNPFSQVNQYCRSLYYECDLINNGKIKLNPIVIMPNYSFKDGNLISISKSKYISNTKYFGFGDCFSFDFLDDVNNSILPLEVSNLKNIKEILELNYIPAINDEYTIFSSIINALNNNKDVIIHGTAGSGKTVMALCLLKHLYQSMLDNGIARNMMYCASNELIQYILKNINFGVPNSVFKMFGSAIKNRISDTIMIFDESQRMYLSQVDSLLETKKSMETRLIWFIDELQSIEVNEDNSVDYLQDKYKKYGCNYEILHLDNQFRCNGDVRYINDLYSFIQLENISLKKYPIFISNDINKAFKMYKSFDKQKRGIVHTDSWASGHIVIDGFVKDTLKEFGVWQDLYDDTPVSVFKAQGCQKDNVLFLWGKDFVIRNKKWEIQRAFVKNKKWDSYFTNNESILYRKMKAILYVLMSRHKNNLIIYFDDTETYNFFKNNLKEID